MALRTASILSVLSLVAASTASAQLRVVPSLNTYLSAALADVDGSADSAAAKDRQATLADIRKLLKDAVAPKEYRSFHPVEVEGNADLRVEVVFRGNIATSNCFLFATKWPGNIGWLPDQDRRAVGLLLTTRIGEQRKFAGFDDCCSWQTVAEDALMRAARWCWDNIDRVKP